MEGKKERTPPPSTPTTPLPPRQNSKAAKSTEPQSSTSGTTQGWHPPPAQEQGQVETGSGSSGFCLTESSPNRHPKCLSIGCA